MPEYKPGSNFESLTRCWVVSVIEYYDDGKWRVVKYIFDEEGKKIGVIDPNLMSPYDRLSLDDSE